MKPESDSLYCNLTNFKTRIVIRVRKVKKKKIIIKFASDSLANYETCLRTILSLSPAPFPHWPHPFLRFEFFFPSIICESFIIYLFYSAQAWEIFLANLWFLKIIKFFKCKCCQPKKWKMLSNPDASDRQVKNRSFIIYQRPLTST